MRLRLPLPQMARTLMAACMPILVLLFAGPASAVLLHIDYNVSRVVYTSPLVVLCGIDPSDPDCLHHQLPLLPSTFGIAGDVGVEFIHIDGDFPQELIRLKSDRLRSDALSHGFILDRPFGFLGLMHGENFEVRDEPCFLAPPGCSGVVFHSVRMGAFGSWDGDTLLWDGFERMGFVGFQYSIVARASPIPAPSPLVLSALPLVALAARRSWTRRRQRVVGPG